MKKVLGLDLGTTSIGWALVNEAENSNEKSSIIKLGVRVNPLTVDELKNFEKGKSITTNADRTLKRSMRRSLHRYKLRRENLIEILKEHGFINNNTTLSENGKNTTHETYRLRAQAVDNQITLEQLARVLLMINKKRGYKSSRKLKGQDEGQQIDELEIAKELYEKNLTPGQFCLQRIKEGKKNLPDFYRSDLQNEFDRIWNFQKQFYPEILTNDLKEQLRNKTEKATWAICEKPFQIVGIKRTGTREELKRENYEWRSKAITEKTDLERLVIVLQKINGQINRSSGYLGAISDRSKELYFNKITVGQYLFNLLQTQPNKSLKNKLFYRQDYLDEFNSIWEKQAQYHKILTEDLKQEIRDVIIFYQRKLKSQKGLISFCEFESTQKEIEIKGKKKIITIGNRVIPRSSPLYQEFRIWQNLNNIEVFLKGQKNRRNISIKEPNSTSNTFECRTLLEEEKELLFKELLIRDKLDKEDALKLLFDNYDELDLNYQKLEGNRTLGVLFRAYNDIIEMSGHNRIEFNENSTDEILLSFEAIFKTLGFNTDILHFDSEKQLDKQPLFKLWHLLYSYEGDNSNTGTYSLENKISALCSMEKEYTKPLINITFEADYGNLSAKAIRKILPYLKAGNKYDIACKYAGYRHSKSSLTKEELENKVLKERLEILPRNSLRNPVVEKILNQMINVINNLICTYGKPDEIRIELARELKKSAGEREELSKVINKNNKLNEEITKILREEYNLEFVSRNDIIRYKLYQELAANSFKTLYSNTYIPREKLFSKEFDIEHIIPQARLFDNSFSNKTLEKREINIEKGDRTAYDFIKEQYGPIVLDDYLSKIDNLKRDGIISKAKYNKLKMSLEDIPEDFIERDLRNTQFITRKALAMLREIVKTVVPTTGAVTDKLREDWQLVDVMKELNWEKYKALGLIEYYDDGNGKKIGRIKDWTKRNDHRHHAMDALIIAFTKNVYIQYFNNVNSRYDKTSIVYSIEKKYFEEKKVKSPIPINEFRAEAKKHLESVLVSIKSKNKVITKNINITKNNKGKQEFIQLTPRGQLHLETVYGRHYRPVYKEIKIGATMNREFAEKIINPNFKNAIIKRLAENNNDPIKAFTGKNSLEKNSLFTVGSEKKKIPHKLKIIMFEPIYTIRKEITPDLNVDKVIDTRIKKILQKRIEEFGDPKKAFSNLEENPIWLNKEKNIPVKRVTISGITTAEALHEKRDKEGQIIRDWHGNIQPVDFVNTGNNHHVSVYRNANGDIEEVVVSFYEAVKRLISGAPVIDKDYRISEGWTFLYSIKQNEYFVFPNKNTGFEPKEIDLMDPVNYSLISPNLFRVQKFSFRNYVFRHHLETNVQMDYKMKGITWTDFRSSKGLDTIVKVQINHIGQLVHVGEY